MLKTILFPIMLPILLLFSNGSDSSTNHKPINQPSKHSVARVETINKESTKSTSSKQDGVVSETGTLEKMIVADGNATLDIDVNRLNGAGSSAQKSFRFALAPDSFFSVLVFEKALRGPESGSIALIPQSSGDFPAQLSASFSNLIIEKTAWGEPFDLIVRDGKSGFIFFNVEGNLYEYDVKKQVLNIKEGRLLLSEQFAEQLGRAKEANSEVGSISVSAKLRVIEVTQVVNGEARSSLLPSPNGALVPGPDVIVGELVGLAQFGSSAGSQVGLAVGTDSCNAGAEPLHWFANPTNDHPVIPQNLYRMSGGSGNDERFEQVGQSSVKHAFTALQQNICGFGCQSSGTGTLLGAGCSDPYSASLNAGPNLGSRAWINPFTGAYPRNDSPTPNNNHTGHAHLGPSHRVLVNTTDLNTTLNPGATYYAEAQYVTPHEYQWCLANPGQCNMYNNVSYRRYNVAGTASPFSFSSVGATVRSKSAIIAWTGATIKELEPDPGNDGIAFVAYKVTNPSPGVWHYEYAVYNQNLDRAIQSFSVPIAAGSSVSNTGFHAPPQHPGWTGDGTVGNTGFSSAPWPAVQAANSLSWASETLAQNPNANAIRWGTLYNYRFDSDRPPQTANATVGFLKTGAPITVEIQAPVDAGPGGASASFIATDNTTQGNWNGTYGADGYNIIGDTVNYPAYAQVNPTGNLLYTWEGSTSDVRALRKASLSDRIAATWYSATSFTINLNLTDAQQHQIALYFIDWDSQGRSQTVIRDASTNALLDTRSLSSFSQGRYLVWNITGNVNIVVTRNAGPNAVVSGLFFGPGAGPTPTPTPTPSPGGASASFITTDTTTQGNWNGTYGVDGYNIIGDSTNYPAYAQVVPSNNLQFTWQNSTTDPRALRKASLVDRIAATWYSPTSFTINLNLTDALPHQIALYCLDWDNGGRAQTIEIRDASNNALLDTRSLSSFSQGRYLVWTITGNVNIVVTRTAGLNAVVSGIFFGGGGAPTPTPTPAAAAFISTDNATQGNWNGTYGSDGFNIIGDTVNYPGYAQVNPTNNSFFTWAASTTDVRALRKALSLDRIAATWYADSFTVNLNLTDGNAHRVALYFVDWDSSGRSQTVEIRDGTSNTLLDARSVTAFSGGRYLVWTIRGNVNIIVTRNTGPNAVLSGLFFQPAPAPDFNAVSVAAGIASPTAMAFAPDGRLFVCQQTGQLRIIKNGLLLSDAFVTIPVNSIGERGLLGVTFDPNFATNQFVYVYYTTSTAPIHNRVSRFTASGDVAVPLSEQVLVDLENLSASNHNGGAIHFGPDGKLYVAVGENAVASNAQTLNNRLGKLLRINSDGSIPADNPFFATATGNNRAIWALGLRNPYTFDFQPGTGRMFINDVGEVSWEEINDGIAGSNYGWNNCEGICGNPSFRDPLFAYGHTIGPTTGCAITGGAFYNPTRVTYPTEFVGKYFFADFCSGWIRRFDPTTQTAAAFRTGLSSPVDLKVGSDGYLYYLVRGGGGGVFKLVHV